MQAQRTTARNEWQKKIISEIRGEIHSLHAFAFGDMWTIGEEISHKPRRKPNYVDHTIGENFIRHIVVSTYLLLVTLISDSRFQSASRIDFLLLLNAHEHRTIYMGCEFFIILHVFAVNLASKVSHMLWTNTCFISWYYFL